MINIDGYELRDVIRRIKKINIDNQIESLLNNIENGYLEIVSIRKINDDTQKVTGYERCTENLDLILNSYDKLKDILLYSNNIKKDLYLNEYDEGSQLEIRFLNENNNINELIKSISLINSIYNNVNELIGDEKENLKFNRIESGSLMVYLTGCVTSLITIKPLLELAYKVYSDNFSPKAKLELELKTVELTEKKIKVRGEYWKLIKEANSNNELKNLDEIDKKKILSNLADLENDISELYSLNPFIKIDNKEVGLKEMKDNVIPIKLLKESYSEEVIEELEFN